jgi:hypothetical protein
MESQEQASYEHERANHEKPRQQHSITTRKPKQKGESHAKQLESTSTTPGKASKTGMSEELQHPSTKLRQLKPERPV